MTLRRTRLLVPLLAVSLAGVAAFAPPAAAQSKSDKAILKAGVITKADVPPDWASKKSTSTDRAYKGIPECKELKSAVDNAKKKVPRAQSREYSEPTSRSTTSAESTVYAFKKVSDAQEFTAVYQAPDASACLEKAAAKVASGQATAGEPSVSPISNLDGVGDEAVGYEITVPYSAGNQSATLYVDLIAVRVGRAFIGFNFSNLGETISGGPSIVQSVVARVAEAQASA